MSNKVTSEQAKAKLNETLDQLFAKYAGYGWLPESGRTYQSLRTNIHADPSRLIDSMKKIGSLDNIQGAQRDNLDGTVKAAFDCLLNHELCRLFGSDAQLREADEKLTRAKDMLEIASEKLGDLSEHEYSATDTIR